MTNNLFIPRVVYNEKTLPSAVTQVNCIRFSQKTVRATMLCEWTWSLTAELRVGLVWHIQLLSCDFRFGSNLFRRITKLAWRYRHVRGKKTIVFVVRRRALKLLSCVLQRLCGSNCCYKSFTINRRDSRSHRPEKAVRCLKEFMPVYMWLSSWYDCASALVNRSISLIFWRMNRAIIDWCFAREVISGVSQGCILGSILFFIYMEDINTVAEMLYRCC